MVATLGPIETPFGERPPPPSKLDDVDTEFAESLRAPPRRGELRGQQSLALQAVEKRDAEHAREVVIARSRCLQVRTDEGLLERARRPAGGDNRERFDRGRDVWEGQPVEALAAVC